MTDRVKPKKYQPTKYKPQYCQELIDHMATGLSFETFGADRNVGRTTLYEWVDMYPEFKEAKAIAFDKCQQWWEKTGIEGMFMGGKDNPFQSSIWNFNMSARFKWSQKVENKLDGKVSLENIIAESNPGADDGANS